MFDLKVWRAGQRIVPVNEQLLFRVPATGIETARQRIERSNRDLFTYHSYAISYEADHQPIQGTKDALLRLFRPQAFKKDDFDRVRPFDRKDVRVLTRAVRGSRVINEVALDFVVSEQARLDRSTVTSVLNGLFESMGYQPDGEPQSKTVDTTPCFGSHDAEYLTLRRYFFVGHGLCIFLDTFFESYQDPLCPSSYSEESLVSGRIRFRIADDTSIYDPNHYRRLKTGVINFLGPLVASQSSVQWEWPLFSSFLVIKSLRDR